MKKITLITLFTTLLFSNSSFAKNNARTLLNESCTKCHGDEVYSRTDHKATDLKDLTRRVNFCKGPSDAKWFEDETKEVIDYLNEQFYHFEQ